MHFAGNFWGKSTIFKEETTRFNKKGTLAIQILRIGSPGKLRPFGRSKVDNDNFRLGSATYLSLAQHVLLGCFPKFFGRVLCVADRTILILIKGLFGPL